MKKEIVLSRLSFIKYLFFQASREADQPEPICCKSILSFHDAVELILQLIAEELNIKTDRFSFMDYWPALDKELELAGKPLMTQKESMSRLNKSRVAFKHSGIFPSKGDIEAFNILSKEFFLDCCNNFFEIDENNISMIEVITNSKVREYMHIASNEFENSNPIKTIEALSLAFDFLITDYEHTKQRQYYGSLFDFCENFHFTRLKTGVSNMDDFGENVKTSIQNIAIALKILSFGFDYKKYAKFAYLVPEPMKFIGGNIEVYVPKDTKLTNEEFNHCFNFIIECALKLQEFDFEIENN